MSLLRERMSDPKEFLCGVEVVSTRGSMADDRAVKTRKMVNQLIDMPRVDWLSITDNAGGHPQLKPVALGKTILYAGKQVVIHLSCKDFNRNGLESEAWELASEGFENILALSGDYPVDGYRGVAKPVFDIDSVALVKMLTEMNHGLGIRVGKKKEQKLLDTHFFLGAACTNIKLHENEVMPQYMKLRKKLEVGAHFLINQIGYDSRKHDEMKKVLDTVVERPDVPLIGNVYMLSGGVAKFFNSGKIPGVVVSDELKDECVKRADSPDKGKSWFRELAARQVAVYKGLGFRGVYFGGVHAAGDISVIMEQAESFAEDDWKTFARDIRYGRPGEFYYFSEHPESGLADVDRVNPVYEASLKKRSKSKHVTFSYKTSKWVHDHVFTPGRGMFGAGAKLYGKASDPDKGPAFLRGVERLSKAALFDCRDCGDCSLPDVAFLCPESQCVKNQRNGPCGGTRDGICEASELDCIWARAYDRLKYEGRADTLLDHAPVIQDQGLRSTSSWSNTFLQRDHHGLKKASK